MSMNPVSLKHLQPDIMTQNVAHFNSMLEEYKQQQQEKIRQLESKIESLEEELRIIHEFNDRFDDL
jgi:Na+/phosphate symporter